MALAKDILGTARTVAASSAKAANNSLNILSNKTSKAASTANAVSAGAQSAQAAFNQASTDNANELTQKMWEQTAAYNAEEAQKNRDWQERMSNTAIQRQVKDLIAAGINPILAAQLGGASTGTGSTASMANATGQAASVGNYTGQMENTNGWLALIGVAAEAFSGVVNGLQALGNDKSTQNTINEITSTAKSVIGEMEHKWNTFWDGNNGEEGMNNGSHWSGASHKY